MILSLAFSWLALTVAQAAPAVPATAPSGPTIAAATKIPLHLTKMISSHDAASGDKFSFMVDQDVAVNGVTIIARCTVGSGTVAFSGKHGINGHEGNLHLRFDSVPAIDGTMVALSPTEQQFNGKDRKVEAALVSRWINGDDVEVPPTQPSFAEVAVDTAIKGAATAASAPACPAPSAAPVSTTP